MLQHTGVGGAQADVGHVGAERGDLQRQPRRVAAGRLEQHSPLPASPTPQRAVGRTRAAVPIVQRHVDGLRAQRRDLGRHAPIRRHLIGPGILAELTVEVLPPTPQDAVGRPCAGVCPTGCGGRDRRAERRDLHRLPTIGRRAVAQLAVGVRAPTPQLPSVVRAHVCEPPGATCTVLVPSAVILDSAATGPRWCRLPASRTRYHPSTIASRPSLAQLWSKPSAKLVTGSPRPRTRVGCRLPMVVPSPRTPYSLVPQHHTDPSRFSAQLCCLRTARSVVSVPSPVTCTESIRLIVVPSPSVPPSLAPQHHTVPSSLRAQVKFPPAPKRL